MKKTNKPMVEDQPITKENVLQLEKEYKEALERYHQQNASIVRITMIGDDYRGDLCVVHFLDKVERRFKGGYFPSLYEIYKEGVKIGEEEVYYGNGGKSDRVASSSFTAESGVEVILP